MPMPWQKWYHAQLLLHRLTEVGVRHDRVLRDFGRKLFVKVGRVNCALLHHVSIALVVSVAHAYPDLSRFEITSRLACIVP